MWIDDHSDDDLIEQLAAALDDVQVTVGYGVKRTGVDGASHVREWYRNPVNFVIMS